MESIKEITSETAIDMNNLSSASETKSDDFDHHRKKISQIIVSQYIQDMSYAVTYSEVDNSILGWKVNIEENGQQQPDVYFELDPSYKKFNIIKFVLYNKILAFVCYEKWRQRRYRVGLVDLSGGEGRALKLKHATEEVGECDVDGEGRALQLKHAAEEVEVEEYDVGFLPNGNLILVSLNNYKIYLHSFKNKPTAKATLWQYSKMYDMKIPESLRAIKTAKGTRLECFIYQTKLFLFYGIQSMTQWNLLTMTFDMQYNLLDVDVDNYGSEYGFNIMTNKNQTLLALNISSKIYIFSMKTGTCISRYDFSSIPIEFVTLKDDSEGLVIQSNFDYKHKFLDPFLPSDTIDIVTNVIKWNDKFVITKSNRKVSIIENNVLVSDGLNEDTFQQILNKTYHSNIYTLPIFKTIQSMLKDVINKEYNNFPDDCKIELTDGELFHFNLEITETYGRFSIQGFTKSQNENEWKETPIRHYCTGILSYKQLNNQDLVLITTQGIFIYTIVEDSLRLRYFWNNEKWNKRFEKVEDKSAKISETLIQEILDNEFSNSLTSIQLPNFTIIFEKDYSYEITDPERENYKELYTSIIDNPMEFSTLGSKLLEMAIDEKKDSIVDSIYDKIDKIDPVEFSKFGSKILEVAIDKKKDSIVQLIFKKIFQLIKNENYKSNNLANYYYMSSISLILPKLCDHYYSSLLMKYILHTSILLDLVYPSVKNSTNTSLDAYTKDIYIKRSSNSYFKSLIPKNLIQIQEENPTISLIVPFPKICKYQDDTYNSWNEMLYNSKSILFCNIDTKNFYKWWNFAAIIDYKWKTYGKTYYYLIWSFFTTFFACFMIASELNNNIFYIISIFLGFAHLYFEFRQFLWKPKIYFNDLWNIFDLGAYSLPIITSIYYLINGIPPFWVTAFSALLLNFKFLTFFRAFQSYGKYFAIIIGVAKEISPFLVVLFIIIFGFAYAFYVTLGSYNPLDLATTYDSVDTDGIISSSPTLMQSVDSNTNMFNWFPTAILAMYLFLTGDSGSISSWTYRDNPMMTILLFLLTSSTVIYLMNLFIGLLNMAIEDHNKYEEFLLLKAQIIMEIELFYMLPFQRHEREWFPDWIYYNIPVNEVRKLINAIDNNKTEFDSPPFTPFISKKLRKLIEVPEPVNKSVDELKKQMKNENEQTKNELKQTKGELKQQTESELRQIKDELKQQMNDGLEQTKDELKQMNDELKQQIKNMQELLSSFIKNSNSNNKID